VAIAFPLLGSLLALKKKQLVVISARPKVGKTTFALNLVNQIAKEGKKCLIFSFEMSGFEIVQKLVNLNYPKADKDLDYTKKVQNFLRKSHGENIVIIESSGLSPAEIKLKIQTHNPEIVIIDQLDCLPLNHRIERHDLRVGENVSALKKIAIETGTLLFLLHQLNRGADAKITPELQNLKDTSIVEQKADIVLMLWEKIISGYPTFFCRIGANRMGDTGTVSFDFLKSASLFLEKGIHLCEE
jgi:replicative DNA helicase